MPASVKTKARKQGRGFGRVKKVVEPVGLNRLRKVRAVVAKIAPREINMDEIYAPVGTNCGCALHHATQLRGFDVTDTTTNAFFKIPGETWAHLFGAGQYSPSTGLLAKKEFLRRIDAVIAKKVKALRTGASS